MARRKKDIIWPHLCDAGGDPCKLWYVEYSLRNPVNNKMERFRHYDGFRGIPAEERYLFANQLIEDYKRKIITGEIGFVDIVEYTDMLIYDGSATFAKAQETASGSTRFYISDFIEYKKPEISLKTLQTYRSKFRYFIFYLESKKLADKPVSFINNDIIVDFLRKMTDERSLSRRSIEKYQQILYTFFTYIINVKKIQMQHPVMNVPRMGSIVDKASAAIDKENRIKLQQLIENEDPQLWMACCFIYYTAIRPHTELRLMKLDQINYNSHTIVIRNYLAKTKRTETIDIPDQLYYMITEEWKLQNYNQELYVFSKDNFPGEFPLGKNSMRIRFNQFRDRLNLPKDVHYYSWKHSGAQELADSGISTYELQRHLRHRDLATTESYLKKRIGQKSSTIKHNFPSIG